MKSACRSRYPPQDSTNESPVVMAVPVLYLQMREPMMREKERNAYNWVAIVLSLAGMRPPMSKSPLNPVAFSISSRARCATRGSSSIRLERCRQADPATDTGTETYA